ncbi:hypothetical protein ACHELS_000870 [Vibrio vulnificus]|uniref:hypothetical protein n=1 Tax=Vibrio vulnificus TaxID=672 RepID=UPI0012FBA91C|nr:hypothetical protein [Vibrio vulnificus]ELK8507314.1 hypothetical protein [Vibrio vulnificus]ELK8993895.1 hypothetical protein [Vibrio vulnificus]ELS3554374.1 hypothetical protein [Vibrio vulnificus]MCJ0817498.1 hypothetical protein [Vibrio vulnificus]MVT21885.1 hypothetical protein [Vibrio vulnificus]
MSLVSKFKRSLCSEEARYIYLKKKLDELECVDRNEIGIFIKENIILISSHLVKNNMALIVRDIGDDSFLECLFACIRSEENYRRRGTVLYAISKFNAKEYLYELTHYVVTDTLESRNNALDAIENINGFIDYETILKCKNIVEDAYYLRKNKKHLNEDDELFISDLEYLLDLLEG